MSVNRIDLEDVESYFEEKIQDTQVLHGTTLDLRYRLIFYL
jgi:hypothetical protein